MKICKECKRLIKKVRRVKKTNVTNTTFKCSVDDELLNKLDIEVIECNKFKSNVKG